MSFTEEILLKGRAGKMLKRQENSRVLIPVLPASRLEFKTGALSRRHL